MESLPPGLHELRGPHGWGFASEVAREWAAGVLSTGRRFRDVAEADPDALALRGRGAVWAIRQGGSRWVVRPYRRGGLVAAPLLGDRHLRGGRPRPVAEAEASSELLRRGIPTPRVLAGGVYPSGAFYRADLVTEYVGGSTDLAGVLFGDSVSAAISREAALTLAGRLLGEMACAGVVHPDMNARNILFAERTDSSGLAHSGSSAGTTAMVLDLDRCSVQPRGSSASPAEMLARLERSLTKIARARGAEVHASDVSLLRSAALEAR